MERISRSITEDILMLATPVVAILSVGAIAPGNIIATYVIMQRAGSQKLLFAGFAHRLVPLARV